MLHVIFIIYNIYLLDFSRSRENEKKSRCFPCFFFFFVFYNIMPRQDITTKKTKKWKPKRDWKFAYNEDKKATRANEYHIPEPMHRVGPPMTTSGISFRKLPTPSFQELWKICKFYEAKCSGIYDSKSPAARYLYSFSREIASQIAVLENKFDDAMGTSKDIRYLYNSTGIL